MEQALVLALASGAAGVLSLYGSWRGWWQRPLALSCGWALLLLSCWLWMASKGVELGIVYALLAISILAWLAVAANYETRRHHKTPPQRVEALVLPQGRSLGRHLLLFVGVVPLAGSAAILGSVMLVHMTGWQPVNAMVSGILLMPVLWGLGAWWVCADSRSQRPLLALLLCTLLPAFYIYG
ncbi:MAG TPA: hypothetical protein GX696_11205 [Pseudomonadaceae bacterium]|nr:hypothetical protein [Pseudomonadaceae bacterium]